MLARAASARRCRSSSSPCVDRRRQLNAGGDDGARSDNDAWRLAGARFNSLFVESLRASRPPRPVEHLANAPVLPPSLPTTLSRRPTGSRRRPGSSTTTISSTRQRLCVKGDASAEVHRLVVVVVTCYRARACRRLLLLLLVRRASTSRAARILINDVTDNCNH